MIRIRPFHYLHIKDSNTNIVRVVTGPKTLTCLDHEKVVFGPDKMVVIPPRHYVIIDNPAKTKEVIDPVTKEKTFAPIMDENGQVLLQHGDQEVRFHQSPFPLYEGEKCSKVMPLQIIEENTALKLKAKRNFMDRYAQEGDKVDRKAGEEWLYKGPGTYYPQVEVEIIETVRAIILKPNQALKLRAKEDCKDYEGKNRRPGEEWLVRLEGAYLPNVNEVIVETLNAYILTDTNALHVRAKSTFVDRNKIERKAGTKWLVTNKETEAYIPDVNEEVERQVDLIVLTNKDFCEILEPVDENGKPQLGTRELRRGHQTFFLQPGEKLQGNIQQITILGPENALWLTATEEFTEKVNGQNIRRRPGDEWVHFGPGEYLKPLEVKIQKRANAFLRVEPLGLYYFQPHLFFGSMFAIFFALYLVNRFFNMLFGSETKPEL